MRIDFVNRTKEFAFLEQHLPNIGKVNSIVMLCGDSGVGKSELTRIFINQYDDRIPAIKVPILQAEKNAYTSGHYITKLAQLLNDLAKKDERIYSLSHFFRLGDQSVIMKKNIVGQLTEDLSNLIPFSKTAKGLFDLVFSKGELDESKFFQSTHSDVLYALFEYVRYQLSNIPMIINIENIQSIDERSLDLLCALLSTNNNCLYLLEFTEKDDSGYTFSELTQKFEECPCVISSLFVPALTLDDVKKIIESQPNMSWGILQNSYVRWNGNVRLLIDVLARHRYSIPLVVEKKVDVLEATSLHLASLLPRDLFLLTVIDTHKEPVQKSLLKRLVLYEEAFSLILDVDASLQTLDKHYLVHFSGDEIMLAHDSIRTHLTRTLTYVLYSVIAQRFWLHTYEALLNSGDLYSSRGWQLMKVLYFASLLDYSDKIFILLDLINEEAVKSRDPFKMISYVEEVKKCLIEKEQKKYLKRSIDLCYWLVEIWYNLGYSKKAWQQLEEIILPSRKRNVLKAVLLEQIGRHHETIEFCTNQVTTTEGSASNYELALRLIRLVTNYAIGNTAATKEEFNHLYKNPSFSQFFEYGFLLRNAELVFSYKDSLPYYQESIEHFLSFHATLQACYSRITYGVHLGLTGAIELARSQFKQAAEELGTFISERHSLLNNLAVLLLFERKTGEETEVLFRQALLTADSDFEKVAIANNYLVLLDWQGKKEAAELAVQALLRALERPSFASKEIIRYAYFNIHKFYQGNQEEALASVFREKVDLVGLNETPIWKFWLYGTSMPPNDEEIFLATIDRPISFLSNWNMEFDSSLMCYE